MSKRFAHRWVIVAGLVTFTTASLEANQRLLSETAKAINEAKSGQFDSTIKPAQDDVKPAQGGVQSLTIRTLWVTDASRVERLLGEKAVSWEVRRKGKPGLAIDRQSRTYNRTKAAKEHALSRASCCRLLSLMAASWKVSGWERTTVKTLHSSKPPRRETCHLWILANLCS